jgi:uncharacterized protein (DUF2267 family)
MKDRPFVQEVADRFGCDEHARKRLFRRIPELRDHPTPKKAADVAAQLPTSLKMLWLSFDDPGRKVARLHECHVLSQLPERSQRIMASSRRRMPSNTDRADACPGVG